MVAHSAVRLELRCGAPTTSFSRTTPSSRRAPWSLPPARSTTSRRIANLAKFEGLGVYYGATYMEAQLCEGDDVIVVGGGNSAGQAAVFLSQTARKVYMLVRSGQLADTMSRYLIRRIEENPAHRAALQHRDRCAWKATRNWSA